MVATSCKWNEGNSGLHVLYRHGRVPLIFGWLFTEPGKYTMTLAETRARKMLPQVFQNISSFSSHHIGHKVEYPNHVNDINAIS